MTVTGGPAQDLAEQEARSLAAEQFAGSLLVVLGVVQALQGIALADGSASAPVTEAYALDVAVWGWFLLVLGAGGMAVGVGLLLGTPWARTLGVLAALTPALVNFVLMPHFPGWSIVAITLAVAAVWGVSVAGRNRPA